MGFYFTLPSIYDYHPSIMYKSSITLRGELLGDRSIVLRSITLISMTNSTHLLTLCLSWQLQDIQWPKRFHPVLLWPMTPCHMTNPLCSCQKPSWSEKIWSLKCQHVFTSVASNSFNLNFILFRITIVMIGGYT